MDKNKKYGNISVATLHRVVGILSTLEEFRIELPEQIQQATRYKKEKIFGTDFSWTRLYRFSLYRNLLVFLLISGLSGVIKKVKKRKSANPTEEIIDEFESFTEFTGGPFGLFKEKLLFEYFYPLAKSGEAISLYGATMNRLLKRGVEGEDKAFFQAVRVDRSVISYMGMTSRIAKAEMEGDEEFFKNLRNALTAKVGNLTDYSTLRYVLAVLHGSNALDSLSQKEAYELLVKELRLYPQTGEDPERSLWQFITRWKAEADIDIQK